MTRFDAADPAERRKLYVDAITAHRQRGSAFLTLEADEAVLEAERDSEATDEPTSGAAERGPDPELGLPWIQFGDGTINLDCSQTELDSLKDVLNEFPAFKIDDIHRPDDAAGVNVRVSAKADPNRIAQCLDAIFQQVYAVPADCRVWVTEL